ncbi:MAG: autotransporter domain-containing protein [Reyranella sp.]|nr:autotransporter domain-containing protein [Reyranella sp.]
MDNTRLGIYVGINGSPGKPYLFDTGSTLFNAAYHSAWWAGFANAPTSNNAPTTPGLPTGVAYKYLGDSQPFYTGNIVQVPLLTFYQSGNLTTPVASLSSGAGFQVNALYQGTDAKGNTIYFPRYFDDHTRAPMGDTWYGTFGAGNFTSSLDTSTSATYLAGGILGQAVIPGMAAQGYVLSANGQANPTNAGSSIVNTPRSGNSSVTVGGQQVQLCSPCVSLGLTPAVLGQFMPVGLPANNPGLVGAMRTARGEYFPVSGNPGSVQDSIRINATLNGGTVTTSALLDTGTVNLGINQNLSGGTAGNTLIVVGVDAKGNPIVALPTSSMTLTDSGVYSRNTQHTYANMTLGIGFFMQNSVLYDLSDGLLSWTPYFVTTQPLVTTADGPLIIGGSNVMLGLAGVISGPGGVIINSGGNAQLSAVNTYTGPTLINPGGTLLISGPGSIAQSSGVTNNGIFDISRAWQPVAVQSLAGSGTIYLGPQNLTITNGSGTYTGNIADAGGAYNVAGGSLTLAGGSLTLAGTNTYTGGTSVSGGTLTLSGSMVGPLSILPGGTFALAPGGSYANPGGTVANSGTLVVNGTLSSNVLNGGLLTGAGTIVGNVLNGGIVAPGNSIGTLSIAGNYIHGSPASYMVEANASGQSDLINVGGTANLQGGPVFVSAQPGTTYAPRTTYRIVSAAGGLSGTFSSVNELYPFLLSSLSYDANNAYLTLQIGGFAAAAVNPIQYAVGTVLDANVNNATGDFAQVLSAMATNVVTDQAAQSVLQQLSGNNYAGLSSSMVQGAQLFMNNFAGQTGGSASFGGSRVALAEACDVACDPNALPQWGAWGGGIGGFGTIGANAPVGGVTYNAGGFAAGIDRVITSSTRLGVTAGYTSGTQWVSGFAGQSKSDTFNVGLYGNYAQDKVYADALVGYAYSGNQMWRPISIPGLQPRTALGQTGANQWYGQLESGYRFDIGTAANAFVTPFARLQAYTGTQNAFTETGAQSLSLTVAQQTTNSLRSVLGAQLGGAMDLGWREKLAMQFRLGWSHEYADVGRPVTATLAGAPAMPFTTFGVSPQRDGIVLGLSANTAIADATSIYLRYEGNIAGQDSAQAITAGVRMTW